VSTNFITILIAGITGTLPDDLMYLRHLEELDLEYTSISGTLPVLCSPDDFSALTDVFLQGMQLNGSASEAFEHCTDLITLDLQPFGMPVCTTAPTHIECQSPI
jgi:hypothetical protein